MTARTEATETEVVSNERHESKSLRLLRLISSSLPKDKDELISKRSIQLISLSEAAGMSEDEINPFLTQNKGLIIRTQRASKHKGPAVFELVKGYDTRGQVEKYVESVSNKRVNPIIKPRMSEYRGPR